MKAMLKKQLAFILAAAFCVATFAGCSGNGSGSQTNDDSITSTSTKKDEIVVLLAGEPTTLDPTKSNTNDIGIVTTYIMEGLIYEEHSGEHTSKLLESWEFADENMTLNIKLKQGVKFSDGSEMTAEDVMWNLKRCKEAPLTHSYFSSLDIEKCVIVDDYNISLKFTRPDPAFLDSLATMRAYIVSKAAYEKDGEDGISRAPVSVGPYKLVEWVSGTHIKLEANEYYHGGVQEVKHITLKFIPESSARVIEMETGAADIVYSIDPLDIDRVNNIDGYKIVQGDSLRYYLITLSMQEPLFQDKKVRYALTHAIDKASLVKASAGGVGTAISSMAPPLASDGTKVMPEIPYDVELAKKLLAEAGYPNGFEIDLHVEPNAEMQKLAEIVQSMWAEIGVKANIVSVALATYDAQNQGKFQAAIRTGSVRDITVIWSIYEISFGSRLNPNDEVLDSMLQELKTYFPGDPRRTALADEIADYLYDIRFSYPFMTMPTIYAVSDRIEGFKFHGTPHLIDPRGWSIVE